MNDRSGISDVRWAVTGTALLLVAVFVTWYSRSKEDPARRLASKASKIDLVEEIRASLASASEAERSAVLAAADVDAQRLADEARTAKKVANRARESLATSLAPSATGREQELFAEFSKSLSELNRIDEDLLALAVQHTNLKATALAFGPATSAVEDMSASIARVVAKSSAAPDAGEVTRLALGARATALHLQTLLSPHIAEPSDEKMDELEKRMTADDAEARSDLDALAALPGLADDADVRGAASSYARFAEIRKEILSLSRRNTDVRSVSLSLDRQRTILFLCLHSLELLEQAILEEPTPGVDYRPPNPRRLGDSECIPYPRRAGIDPCLLEPGRAGVR